MKTSIEKRRKHAEELLVLLKRIEREVKREPSEEMLRRRKIVDNYDKAIKILKRSHFHEEPIHDLITEWSFARAELAYQVMEDSVSRLKLLKTNLETERDS